MQLVIMTALKPMQCDSEFEKHIMDRNGERTRIHLVDSKGSMRENRKE